MLPWLLCSSSHHSRLIRDEKTATYYTVDATWREGPSVASGRDGEKEGKEKGDTEGRMSDR